MKRNSQLPSPQSGYDRANAAGCPCCNSDDLMIFHRTKRVPVNSVLNISSRDEALLFPRGDIYLGLCRKCGFIYNTKFDPALVQYSSDCEESQGYSPTFNSFARELADNLIKKYHLSHKKIIEIGCGKGEFLKLICDLGQNTGVGFDPAYVARGRDADTSGRITFIKDYYSEKYANFRGDMVCCRMTLEHIYHTADMVNIVRRSIGDEHNTVVFFQVPDAARIFLNCAFEDIYYEHCSYFSAGSLARLFRSCRFEILDLRTVYNGQYIIIEARPAPEPTLANLYLEDDLSQLKSYVAQFETSYQQVIYFWQKKFKEIKKEAKRVVVWGSGSKGVAFLTNLPNSHLVEYVVDINPFKQGNFMAGTGQAIVSPEFLRTYQPEIVIVMNPIYLGEIKIDLNRMGLEPEILAMGEHNFQRTENE